jgi:hypothetical protein
MKTNRAIRIIKGAERGGQSIATTPTATNAEAPKQTPRDMAANVATWVKEFRQRRTPDPRRAFAGLFAEPATPLNSIS